MKINHIGIVLAWLVTTLLLTACGGGGGGGNNTPVAPPLTGQLRLTMPLVVGQNTTFDFLTPTSANSYWTPNTPYPADGQFFATWASVVNGPPDVALPYLQVNRSANPNNEYEYLSFRIDSSSGNGHTVYLWSNVNTCLLSGVNAVLTVSLCSTYGIAVDWIAKTITFVQTPLSTTNSQTAINDAGTFKWHIKIHHTLMFTCL